MGITKLSVGASISQGWSLMKKHWLVLIGLMLAYSIIISIISLFGGSNVYSFWYWIIQIFTIVLGWAFSTGYTKMYLNAVDGEEPSFDVFAKTARKIPGFVVIQILYSLIVLVGLALLIVPGIWLACRLFCTPLIYLDRENCTIGDAFRESFEITKGNAGSVFLLYLASIGIAIVGLIACIVGVLPAAVTITFAFICAYRMLRNNNESNSAMENRI